ncbi:MAG: hypothetical protein M3Y89_16865 [Actinomycetota bacterium]|nr:hypothetical protein [Actinomycetota bacterium]
MAFIAGLALSTAALAAVSTVSSSVTVDMVTVLVANAVVSAGRFVSFRGRTFRHHREAMTGSSRDRPGRP